MLDESRLMSATAVKEAQITAANPVTSIAMLYNAANILLPPVITLGVILFV
tara:strand:+ start:488 stop:640 length:153 start_codon:yes stop_codon:yes gene_type:complete